MTATTTGPEAPATHVVTDPGVYVIPEDAYHRDPVPGGSLSYSGAKRLLPPSCPAIFRWEQLHGRPNKPAFDFGHAAHAKVLGIGAPIVVVQTTTKDGAVSDAEDYKTRSAQQHRNDIYAAGDTPILAHELAQVDGMAAAIKAHPLAAKLFDPDLGGQPEQSMFWHDTRHDIWRRSRLDWLPPTLPDGRLIVPDYKTAASAEPFTFARAAAKFGYHLQDAFYTDGLQALGIAEDVTFLFVAQERTAPYLVTVFEFDSEARLAGRLRVGEALETYAQCLATNTWPGYANDVELISLPPWATYDLDMVV